MVDRMAVGLDRQSWIWRCCVQNRAPSYCFFFFCLSTSGAVYRWTDYDSGSSLVCPSNYLSIHPPTPLSLSSAHPIIYLSTPFLLCMSNYLSSIILSTTFFLFEVWHTNPYPHPFSLLCPSKCLSIHHFFCLFTVWTTTPHPIFSLLCPSSYLSLYPLLFSLIYRWTDHSPPFFLSPLPIQLLIYPSTLFAGLTRKRKRQQSLLTECKWPYRDGGIWTWQGEAVDPDCCCHTLNGEAKGGKEVFPEHAVNKVDYGQHEHQVRNGCGQLSCHCEVV